MAAVEDYGTAMKRVFVLGLLILLCLAAAAVAFAIWADGHVAARAAGRVYDNLDEIPKRDVALVLGTSKYANGRLNSFYAARIRAAAALYNAGKVDGILVSGDNGSDDYNEPAEMKADLVALGVPADYITADYAGFRTLDFIYRAEEVFGLQTYTVVSQPFHLERALYLAGQRGQDAIGFAATGPSGYSGPPRAHPRGAGARAGRSGRGTAAPGTALPGRAGLC